MKDLRLDQKMQRRQMLAVEPLLSNAVKLITLCSCGWMQFCHGDAFMLNPRNLITQRCVRFEDRVPVRRVPVWQRSGILTARFPVFIYLDKYMLYKVYKENEICL